MDTSTVELARNASARGSKRRMRPLDVAELLNGCRTLLLQTQPIDGHEASYKALAIVFSDLSADRTR